MKSLLRDEDDDDDDEVLELKDRLAAYNLESSPDQSEGNCLYLFHLVKNHFICWLVKVR